MKTYLYKKNRRIICYIQANKKGWEVCTGKPSDASCLSWQYDNLKDAEKTANEYLKEALTYGR